MDPEQARLQPMDDCWLLVEGGPDDKETIPLTSPTTTMGRQPDNDVIVDDSLVSRRHAEIVKTESGFSLRDLLSANGTFINDNRLSEGDTPLKDGDRIVLAENEVTFIFQSPVSPTQQVTLVNQINRTGVISLQKVQGADATDEAPGVGVSRMGQLEPPYPLIRDALNRGQVIPFLGSGASLGERKPGEEVWQDPQSGYLPTAGELAGYLAQKTYFPEGESTDLAKVAQYYRVVGGLTPLYQDLHTIFDHDFPLTSLHTFLAQVPVPTLIVTTNYDDLIERSLGDRPYDVVVHTTDPTLGDQLLWWPHGESDPVKISANKLDIDLTEVSVVYKIHGAIDRHEPDRDQYVITEDDYIDFLARMTKKKAIPAIFAEPFQTRPFLFLGYSLSDWNLRVVLSRIEKDMRRRKDITSWAIQYDPSALEQRFWQERGVEVYSMLIDEFIKKLSSVP